MSQRIVLWSQKESFFSKKKKKGTRFISFSFKESRLLLLVWRRRKVKKRRRSIVQKKLRNSKDQWTLMEIHLCPFNLVPAAPPAFSFSFRLLARHSTSISTKLIIVRIKHGNNLIMTEWIQKLILWNWKKKQLIRSQLWYWLPVNDELGLITNTFNEVMKVSDGFCCCVFGHF